MRSRHSIVAGVAALVLMCGCGSSATDQSLATAASAATSSSESSATGSASEPLAVSSSSIVVVTTEETTVAASANIDPALQGLVDQAIADLATRLYINRASIVTVSAKPVVWPDKSLGCPQPGMAYNQVTVDGALIELSVGGTTYRYHSGGSRSPFLCQKT